MISAQGVVKSFGKNRVLSGISVSITNHAITSMVGPSGCGKSTLLNLMAGLDVPDSGTIDIESGERLGYMMQDTLLLPWRTLFQNAALGAEVLKRKLLRGSEDLTTYFRAFDLVGAESIYPDAASGGMKQRIALIRTLAIEPSILLLDEPFSSLDFDVKLKIQKFLLDYHRKNRTAIFLVTHDIEDAIALSDEVIVLSSKPATVKARIPIDIGLGKRDPIEARKSPRFTEYFTSIWDEIKYLDDE